MYIYSLKNSLGKVKKLSKSHTVAQNQLERSFFKDYWTFSGWSWNSRWIQKNKILSKDTKHKNWQRQIFWSIISWKEIFSLLLYNMSVNQSTTTRTKMWRFSDTFWHFNKRWKRRNFTLDNPKNIQQQQWLNNEKDK